MSAANKLWERGQPKKDYTGRILHVDFAERMNSAADSNPNIPPLTQGRLTWLRDELAKRGTDISVETCRKWFKGEAKPHRDRGPLLAEIMQVDEAWLMLGVDPGMSTRDRRARNAMADGAVNLIAGLVQMDNGHVAFPEEDDRRAETESVDLYAIIKGANYALHVASTEPESPDEFTFSVPTKLGHTLVVLVVRAADFGFQVFEVSKEAIETFGRNRGGSIEVTVPATEDVLKRITSFKERL